MENQNPAYQKWYMSSNGDGSMSLTLKSALLGLVPIFVYVLAQSGVNLTENEIVEIINQVVAGISVLGVLYGTARKIYNSFK